MIPRTPFVVVTIAVVSLLAACTAVSSAADPPGLDGTAWVLSALPGRTLVADSSVTLRFEAGHATGTDGCNRYGAPYTATGSTLEIASTGVSTLMACPPELTQQAGAFMASLTGARSYRVDAGQLQLLAGDGTLLASLAPQPQGVAGTAWRVTGYNNGKQAVTSVLGGTRLTMAFSADGRVSGSAGCNNYNGTYSSVGSSLTFGPAATTRKMCAEPERIMEQEQQFLTALQTVATARQEGDRLELRTGGGQLAVTLARESAP